MWLGLLLEENIMSSEISYQDFSKVDIRVGKVLKVEPFSKVRKPAYKLLIDFGSLGTKKSSAQITDLYKPEDLENKLVIAVVNFPKKQIADFMSEVLVLGAVDENNPEVVLLEPERDVKPGTRIS